jgi:hypothetical protein
MVTSAAATVDAYLAELPPERREVATALRALIRRHLPEGYAEAMTWGMPTYEVPLARCPDTYNGKPLAYVAFAAQKNNYALYLMRVHAGSAGEQALRVAAAAMGVRLDMGKSCLRFRALDQLPLNAIGALIASHPVEDCIAWYEAAHSPRASAGAAKKTAAAKTTPARARKATVRKATSKRD